MNGPGELPRQTIAKRSGYLSIHSAGVVDRGTYTLVGKSIILNFENNVVYELSSDGKRISSVEANEVDQRIVLELKK